MLGFWEGGIMVFTSAVVVSNLKILLFAEEFNFLLYLTIFGSILVYLLSFLVL